MTPTIAALLTALSSGHVEYFLTDKDKLNQSLWEARRIIQEGDHDNTFLGELLLESAANKINPEEVLQQSVVWLGDHFLNSYMQIIDPTKKRSEQIQLLSDLINIQFKKDKEKQQLQKNIGLLITQYKKNEPINIADYQIISALSMLQEAAAQNKLTPPDEKAIKKIHAAEKSAEQYPYFILRRSSKEKVSKLRDEMKTIERQSQEIIDELQSTIRHYLTHLKTEIANIDNKNTNPLFDLANKKYMVINAIQSHLINNQLSPTKKLANVIKIRNLHATLFTQCRDTELVKLGKWVICKLVSLVSLTLLSDHIHKKLYQTQSDTLLQFESRLFPTSKKAQMDAVDTYLTHAQPIAIRV